MEIEERTVGDALVLDLKGKMTLGEGDELLKDKINSVIAQGRKHVVLNLQGVPYIDSAGFGELVRCYTTVSRQGGRLQLMDLTKRITDLLAITKLLLVFEVVTEDELASGRYVERWSVQCPRCTPVAPIRLKRDEEFQTCLKCGLGLKLSAFPRSRHETVVQCDAFRLATYDAEHVLLQIGQVHEISVVGRLDVFVAETVEELWKLVAPPRRILLVADAKETSEAGLQQVLALCAGESRPSHAAIYLRGSAETPANSMPQDSALHPSYEAAVEALGTASNKLPGVAIQVRYATT